MKYNPTYHQNVVDNLRRAYNQKYGSASILTDAEIWRIYEDNEFTEHADDNTLEEMEDVEQQQTKQQPKD